MTELIFTTVHGSRLYGLSTPASDEDRFTVTTSNRARAKHVVSIALGTDHVTMGLDAFIRNAQEGSHQSVEALFSPYKVWGENSAAWGYKDYLESLRITGSEVFAKYERTIKRFCYGDFKRRRHAVRLHLNLTSLRFEGRFNPVMSPNAIKLANAWATDLEGIRLWERLTT